ncbi:MAG: HNH endonuclease signature motif containing protein [Gammaproteobacteria bacterium]|nr:HNH endonuclease signature motif containing protein [Gammaproteobacteria bacterium]
MAGRLGKRIYSSRRWRRVRRAVMNRDGHRCTGCGKAGVLEVHHRQRLADGGAAYDQANLATICRPCHFGAHRPPVPSDVAEWQEFLHGAR